MGGGGGGLKCRTLPNFGGGNVGEIIVSGGRGGEFSSVGNDGGGGGGGGGWNVADSYILTTIK